MARPKIDKTGEIRLNNYGSKMTIIKYNSSTDVIVKFDNNYIANCIYSQYKNGQVKNPYDKTVYGNGYIGEGIYKAKINGKLTIQYQYWKGMFRRCHDKEQLEKHPSYKDKEICEEWHNFQTFATWFDENYYTVNNEIIHLEKDILHKNNKIYSPNTCIFVPQRINVLFVKNDANRGEYPIGITCNKQSNKFRAQCCVIENDEHKLKYLGSYKTPEDAFYLGYKPFKETYIKDVANDYKAIIPKELYDAMYEYEVEITD